jgi:hypothetical protein
MSLYSCKRCGYTCDFRYLMKRHLSRKTVCPAVLDDIDVSTMITMLNEGVFEKDPPVKTYHCNICKKAFADSSNRYRHQRSCQESNRAEINGLKETINSLQEQVSNLQHAHSSNHTTNNINQTFNNNINITLNNFGNESYDHITNEFIKRCIMNNVFGVKSLIERIHFSEEAPENKNVRIRSLKNNLVEVANDQKWIVKDANEAMEAMIKKGCKILNGFYYNPESGIKDYDINELDTRIQSFLSSIMDRSNQHYFALRRRILALIIEHSDEL